MATLKQENTGRPSTFTQETADLICKLIAEGLSIRTVCNEEGMPVMSTVFLWLREHKDFSEQYARAKEAAVEAMAEEILDIADDGTNDWMDRKMGKETIRVVDNEAIQRSKLRVDTRKWIMSKLKAKKYGDKVDVTSDGKAIEGNTIVFKKFGGTPTDSK